MVCWQLSKRCIASWPLVEDCDVFRWAHDAMDYIFAVVTDFDQDKGHEPKRKQMKQIMHI